MKKPLKRSLQILLALTAAIACFLLYVQFNYNPEYDAPATGIRHSKDSAVIARGQYLVMGPGHCWNCHAADGETNLQTGTVTGLSGGLAFKLPFGTLYSPNITPDSATGIGARSDEMLARAIRFSVKHDNTAMIPFMTYNGMSDEDITAVISYLRSLEPIKNVVEETELNLLGKIVKRFVIKPVGLDSIAPHVMERDTTPEYGRYLAASVGNCVGCHTNRDKNTGEFVGEKFAGGYQMRAKSGTFTTPNLTPDPETGAITHYSVGQFIAKFRAGAVYPETPMPWKSFQTLNDNDLKALFYYFKSMKPVKNPTVRFVAKTEK
ncbi:cytochrome c [Dyadobacter sp. CY323]|uniref:c-type cytochrome n=1 Tax=Dyadobacter sp. CY323 TaxID=2907302 RepID=UPI001F311F6B|nr:cytochrome c [Dyadobacter sp. CY323]MCE6989675.1 cytochrome c [Dyadobacter sp. CY323]